MTRAVDSRWSGAALWVASVLVLLFLILPTLFVIPFSVSGVRYYSFPPQGFSWRWYQEFFSDPDWLAALGNSLMVGLSAAVLAMVIGTLAALALHRSRGPLMRVLELSFTIPMYLPVIVLALGLYALAARLGLVGSLYGLIAAHTILATPLVIVNVAAALHGLDPQLEHAAQTLGASPRRAFFEVTLPLIRGGVLAGGLFGFLISFDELIIALFMSGTTAVTLPLQMWRGLHLENNPTIAAAATLLMLLSIVGFLLAELLRRRVAARHDSGVV